MLVPLLYETVAGTSALAESRSSKVDVVTVAGFIASLNVAVTLAPVATPVAPLAGVTELTVGGVVSAPADGRVHVGLDLGLGQRPVVDANLVDQPVEPLAPDAVAADAQRAGGHVDRAR